MRPIARRTHCSAAGAQEAFMQLRFVLSTALATVIGCGPSHPAPVAAESSPLLGAVNFGSDCTDNDKQFLTKVMHYGRTVAVSNAFAQCMSNAMTSQQAGYIGPYMQCNGDPFYGSPQATQLQQVMEAARSTVDVSINCTGGNGNASAGIDSYGQLTPEGLSFSGWLHAVDNTLGLPVCNGSNGPNCRFAGEPWPWSQAASIVWHEAMHQQGYTHGADDQANAKPACGYANLSDSQWFFQTNTMPYIVQNCISEVISRSGTHCGAPLESGNGLKLITTFNGSSCAVAQDPQSATISWQHVGTPGSAAKIAACTEGDGRVYALNTDRSLWVSHANGNDGSWTWVTTPGSAQQIFCADNTIWAFNDDRTLWRNDGSDSAVRWTYVGKPWGAKQVVGTTSLAIFFPYPVLYALNDDNTLWKSTSGADGSWTRVGDPWAADRIAAGGGLMEARPFALNGNKSFWLNAGDGCDAYWHQIDTLGNTVEIAAASEFTIYALNADHTLWKGAVRGSDWMTTNAFGKARHCDGSSLVAN
jgi:hypothetical protein